MRKKLGTEIRTTIKSGIAAGFSPAVTGSGFSNPSWNSGDGIVNVIGFNYHQQPDFNAIHPIRNKRTWYSMANQSSRQMGKAGYERATQAEQPLSQTSLLSSMIAEKLIPKSMSLFAPNPKVGENQATRVLKDVHNEFKRQSAAYTGTYLTEINRQISQATGSPEPTGETRKLTLRKGAHPSQWASEEETAILADQSSHKKGVKVLEGKRPIGLTQPIDAYIKVGDKIIAVDMSEALAVGEDFKSHHSLTGGPLYKTTEELPKSRETIQKRMKEYYNDEITEKWNPHLRTIKRMAAETYLKGAAQENSSRITADMMRAPTGIGGEGTQSQVAASSGGRVRPMRGGSASITAKRLAGMSKSKADRLAKSVGGTSAGKMTNVVAKHLMHSVGNWSGTVNGMWDTFTLSHTPAHITAGVLLRQYRSGVSKFLYKKVRDEDVKVFDGPATHALVQQMGGTLNKSSNLILNDQMAGHLVRRNMGKKQVVANIGGNTIQAASSQGKRGFSAGIYVPEASLDAHMAHVVNIMLDRVGNEQAERIHSSLQNFNSNTSASAPNDFSNHLNNFKDSRASQVSGASKKDDYSFWAMPYYGIDMITIEPETDN